MQNTTCACVHTAFLCLGSNTVNAQTKLEQANRLIAFLPGVRILAKSSIYHTEPQGFREQPWFANQVLQVAVAPFWRHDHFLAALLGLETIMGRTRGPVRFGPRNIDIDLLLFDNLHTETVNCLLPHPRMIQRAFVLIPLRELAPDLRIFGKTCGQWLALLNYQVCAKKIFQQE